ncbi:eCIS core domain-containing protein [Jatrophihabitans sp.]|uniref:eCIS core domain-containing protein n=1 Tax=Jatrophihabitans sp. TaxID=1932789 RepID=UPI002E1756EF
MTVEPQPAAPLLTDRLRPRSTPARTDGTPEPGRVVGLGTVIVPPPAAAPAAVEPPSYFLDQPPLRHATARPITEHAPLTTATPDYVGEPVAPYVAPAPPPRPAARAEPAVEAASDAGARFREALANLHRRGEPDGLPGQRSMLTPDSPPATEASRPAPPAPPATPASADPARGDAQPPVPGLAPRDPFAAGPPPAPMTHRRNSLAQSRRLGLGAPVQRDADDAAEAATPPPADIAEALEATRAAAEAAIDAANTEAVAAIARAEADAADARVAARAAGQPPPAPPASSPSRPEAPPAGPEAPAAVRPPLTTTPTVRPIADGSTRPPLSVAPLRFRAAPRPIETAVEAPARTPERAVVTRPPAELARALRSTHGVDVADVEIRRDSAVTAEASQRRARAFTRGATVHLPESAGPLTSASARGLLAHELVHAAQQRRLGGALPAEHTPEGRALEAEALDAERAHGGTPPSITSSDPLRHAPPPVTSAWVEDRLTQHALPFEIPQHRPDETLTPQQRDQVRWEANEIAREVVTGAGMAVGGGGGGTSGGGGAGTGTGSSPTGGGAGGDSSSDNPDALPDIGDMHATTFEQFRDGVLAKYNDARASAGLPRILNLPDDQLGKLREEWNAEVAHQKVAREEARKLKDQRADDAAKEKERVEERQKKRKEERDARAKVAQDLPQAGTAWAPGIGMHRTSAGGGAAAVGVAAAGGALAGGALAGIGAGGGQAEIYKAEDALEDAQDKLDDAEAALASATATNTDSLTSLKATDATEFVANLQRSYNFQRHQAGLGPKDLSPTEVNEARELFERTKSQHDSEVGEKRRKDAQAKIDAATKARDAARAHVTKTAERVAARSVAAGTAVVGTAGAEAHPATAVPTTGATTTDAVAVAATVGSDHSTEVVHGDSSHQTHDTANLEALAERIYDRLRSRLRTELLIDRERAGLLTDFR